MRIWLEVRIKKTPHVSWTNILELPTDTEKALYFCALQLPKNPLMKYLFTILFLVPFTVSAQFSKGTVAIGGDMTYYSLLQDSDNSDMPSSKYLTINPSVSLFLTPTFSAGVFVQINSSKVPTINIYTNLFEESKMVSSIYGVTARKYFPLSDKFLISIDGGVGVGGRVVNGNSENKVNQFTASMSPVFTFLPHPKWGIEATFANVSYETNTGSSYTKSNSFSARLGTMGFGINYFINRKTE
jgi:hypothetical protein